MPSAAYVHIALLPCVLVCRMTRPYTALERADSQLYEPEWTDRYDDYVFAASPHWPSSKAVASNISIGELQAALRLGSV
jgi:hypothetical protein